MPHKNSHPTPNEPLWLSVIKSIHLVDWVWAGFLGTSGALIVAGLHIIG